MKTSIIISALAISLVAFTGCKTVNEGDQTKPPTTQTPPKPGPETVLVTYHVQLGREKQLQALIDRAWKTYRSKGMVLSSPHVIVREGEEAGQSRFVEIFTWAKPPDSPSVEIRGLWQEEASLCETRNGHNAIEGGVVELIVGK